MKKFKHLIVILLATLSISCENYLDVVPDNIATIDNAFTDAYQAQKYLFTCYSYIPNPTDVSYTPGWLSGDEIWVNTQMYNLEFKDTQDIARGNQTADSPLLNYYEWGLFRGMRVCNTLINEIDNVPNLEDDEKLRWKAEAKFLKAYYHYYLLKMYGPIPLMDESLAVSASAETVAQARQPFDTCVDFIVNLLDEAVVDLPQEIRDDVEELGRATKLMALSLKSEVLLTAASPLFNGNLDYTNFTSSHGVPFFTSYDNEKWKRAADAAFAAIEMAITIDGHDLYVFNDQVSGLSEDITKLKLTLRGRVTNKWNNEIIWGASNSRDMQWYMQPSFSPEFSTTGQNLSPTMRIVNQYYSSNGIPLEEDLDWVGKNPLAYKEATAADKFNISEGESIPEMHFNRETRFYADLGFDRGTWFGQGNLDENDQFIVRSKKGELSGQITIDRYSITGYFIKKLVNYKSTFSSNLDGFNTQQFTFPIIRLSSLYLNYAEALNEYNGPSGDVYNYVDQIRERAGLEGVVTSWVNHSSNPTKPSSQEGLRQIIQRERLIEFSFENQRYWDLRRWKLAKQYMNRPIKGWTVTAKEKDDYYRQITLYDQKFTTRDYLWPIRSYVLTVNTNLDQNPGW